jgi:hypothetical protein
MTKDEALRLALEALDSVLANHKGAPVLPWIEAKDAIKAALEAEDELTIAYMSGLHRGKELAQRTWVGLTDEERYDLLDKAYNPESYAVLIEDKLKERNI